MHNTQQTFDFLALVWWQNPWYWAVLVMVMSMLLVTACAVYWYCRTALTPQEKIVRKLVQLRALSCATHEEQVQVYQYIFSAIKTHYRALGFSIAPSLTDYELVDFAQTQMSIPFSSELYAITCQTSAVASSIKFGHTTVAPLEVHAHIEQARVIFENICAFEKKNKSASRPKAT